MPNAFDALAEEDSDEDDEREVNDIPAYEDLSLARIDEETVLKTLYGGDFSRKEGPWGSVIFCVNVKPPDIEPERIGSQFTLNTQVGKKYPYVPPKLKFDNVKGLSSKEQDDLMKTLNGRCRELAEFGSVVVCELVEVAEDFLISHNKDPTMSAYDEMRAREEKEREIELEKEKKLHSFMNVTEEHSPSKRTVDSRPNVTFDIVAVQKEMDRQQAALKKAYEDPNAQDENVNKDDVDFIDGFDMSLSGDVGDDYDAFQLDQSKERFDSSSRYKSDFVEIKQIGKGGGGTVFKVQNRLDRRIYAVKKVKLLSEQGKMKLIGKRENSKLRREVTTISGMTHRHIVRYYQAWVEEGDKRGEGKSDECEEESSASENHVSSAELPPSDDESSSGSEESRGFWGHQPMSSFHDSEESWSSESDTENKSDDGNTSGFTSSVSNSKIHENSSLMKEFGFEHHSYSDLFKRDRIESVASSDDLGGFQSSILDQSASQTSKGSSSILYIQMEYCATTLRQLIDERKLEGLGQNECWKMIRQTLEALDYMHDKKVLHRDLKPGNIFLDRENNIRLGDFGLATTRNQNAGSQQQNMGAAEPLGSLDDAIGDVTDTLDDTITGGVGTTFYIAPEQALRQNKVKVQNDYDTKADIFSLGVVIFEMFFPFSTRMERAQLLKILRGDGENSKKRSTKDAIVDSDAWKEEAVIRFPESFRESVKDELQRLILWCVERDPDKRPTAKQLLSSDLIPRQIELDSCYLNDVLQTIANPESESYEQIMNSLFDRHTMHHIEILYDTDDVAKAQELITARRGKSRLVDPRELLAKSLGQIGGFTSGEGVQRVYPSQMNLLSMSAATSTLRRAKGAGKIAKGEVLRNATQQSATVLAMRAATAVAATGRTDGVNGADPRVVKSICDHLTFIFESHGAVPLKPPLLRPKGQTEVPKNLSIKQKKRLDLSSREPSQVLNERGSNLLLPEDLQANFARNIGRGGYALSNVKRYHIDTSYTQSISGGHPRESLEASFDIIIEDHRVSNEYFIAEVIMVVCQAFNILSPLNDPAVATSIRPTWFLRLSHTRLADAILDICGVSTKESLRTFCYHILTSCSAPPPNLIASPTLGRKKGKKKMKKLNKKKICEELIGIAKREHDLSEAAAVRLHAFLDTGCLPLPFDVNAAVDALQEGAKKLRSMDDQRQLPRRQKRYEDVVRGLRSIKNCVDALTSMGITLNNRNGEITSCHGPAYISLDLGLRQPNQHYHGQLYFQAIMLAEDPELILNNEALLDGGGKGILMAEGGRYDDLVRKFRPPGIFGASRVDQYISAPIPVCTGVRFIIGAFIERIYVEAALKAKTEREKTTLSSETDTLRKLLAIPNVSQKGCVQCIVVSMNGFDSASLPERAMVAARLWSNGISAEYLPQSGVILSLFKHAEYDAQLPDANNVWTLDQICDLCCLLHIPFVVVVQHHLLREKNFVRLRHTIDPSSAHNGIHETFVPIASLASEIKERSASGSSTSTVNREFNPSIPSSPFDKISQPFHRELSSSSARPRVLSPTLEYIYVDADQFYLDLDKSSGKDPKLKPLLKMMKKTQLKADPYIEENIQNVLAVDLPFSIVREFNSAAMFSKGPSIASATTDFLKNHPRHKKMLKTLAMCLDFMLRRHEEDNAEPQKHPLLSVLVYAQPDDRFDLLTLDTAKQNGKNNDTTPGHKNTRKDRGGRRY